MMEAFRTEIVEAEKGRTDLLKWKLILVSALGSIGLGISNPSSTAKPMLSLHFALCLIPLVCVYVDLLCKHLQMRILVISEFFRYSEYNNNADEASCFYLYENFCEKVRPVFGLEDWAQQWSTQFLSVIVIVAALILKLQKTDLLVLVFSGVCGIIFTLLIDMAYENKRKNLNNTANEEAEKLKPHEAVQGGSGNVAHTK